MARQPTDIPNKLAHPVAHAFPFPERNVAYFEDGSSELNWEQTKVLGSVAIVANHATLGVTLAMALGPMPESDWMVLDGSKEVITSALTHTPRGRTFISDAKPRIKETLIGGIEFPRVLESDLADATHPVNNYNLSGKKFGAAVIGDDGAGGYTLYVADGHDFESKWVGGAAATAITPTGTLPVPPSSERHPTDIKPELEQTVVTAIPFWVYPRAELVDKAHPVNKGDGVVSGKLRRAMLVDSNAGVPSVRMATGGVDVATWVDVLAPDATDVITPA